MNLLQIATSITKCDDYYKLRQYTHSDWLVSHQPFAHWCTPTKASVVKLSQIETISFLVRSKCTDKIYKWKVEVERVLSCRFVGEWKGQATNLPGRTSSLFLSRRLSLKSFLLGEQKLSLKLCELKFTNFLLALSIKPFSQVVLSIRFFFVFSTRGPFLESPGNFSGPKSSIQIEI